MLGKLLSLILGQDRADRVIDRAVRQCRGRSIFQSLAEVLDLRVEVSDDGMRRVPTSGPVVVVANHPTGFAEGALLGAIFDRARADVKTIGHAWFARYPQLARRMLLVDPAGGGSEKHGKARMFRDAVRWVHKGRLLVVFPAGEVARFQYRGMRVTDAAWQPGVGRIVLATGATVLPVHVTGQNGLVYQLLSMLHPRLGALLLLRELFRKAGRTLEVKIGQPIPFEELPDNRSDEEITRYLQRAVEALRPKRARQSSRPPISIGCDSGPPQGAQRPV